MTVLRHLHVLRFRGVAEAAWAPHDGVNGLIGAGDSGKSTLLDAIDLVLAPRRNMTFSDADFFGLDVSAPIQITATLGGLPDVLQDLDVYGLYLRGWDAAGAAGDLGEERRAAATEELRDFARRAVLFLDSKRQCLQATQ